MLIGHFMYDKIVTVKMRPLIGLIAALIGAPAHAGGPVPTLAGGPLEHPYWERPIPAQGSPPSSLAGTDILADLSAKTCGLCHPAQFEAWRQSLHAGAVSPGLVGQLGAFDAATRQDCLACHAPRQEALDPWQNPVAGRAAIPGVDCASCHVRRHVRLGPRALAGTPHGAVEALPLFREAGFCAPCHQFDDSGLAVNGKPLENTYAEWRASRYAQEGVTCQACHMPQKEHSFKGIHDPETTRSGLTVMAWRTREGLSVRAGNTGAGHALPTYVTPRILIHLDGSEGSPSRVHIVARTMRWSHENGWAELADERLFPDQWVTLDLPLPPQAAGQVTVRVEPDYDYHARVYPSLLQMLKGGLSEEGRSLLERAREQSGTTAYTLYRFSCPPWGGRPRPCREPPLLPSPGTLSDRAMPRVSTACRGQR